ncbi:GTP-binding protein [Streptomyces sp. PHES57]|uniref:GTP-binding protein n=1 Tax=Streptomyces TaxID=1883 RepID=UPI001CECB2CB|nr:GTP-binding protein [Streptomyces sp. PHES57]
MSAHPHPVPHLTIGTLGHQGHGKTTLARALSVPRGAGGGPAGPVPGDPVAAPVPSGFPRRFRCATDTRRYTVLDPARATDRLDGAVLAVSVLEGVRPGTVEHVALARRIGLAPLVVALTMADEGHDVLTERVEAEVRTLLTAHGHNGETLPAVRVSAGRALAGEPRWWGTIDALLDAVDTYVPLPECERGHPGPRSHAG